MSTPPVLKLAGRALRREGGRPFCVCTHLPAGIEGQPEPGDGLSTCRLLREIDDSFQKTRNWDSGSTPSDIPGTNFPIQFQPAGQPAPG